MGSVIWLLAQIAFWPMVIVVAVIAWLGGALIKASSLLMPAVEWVAQCGRPNT